MSNILLEQYGLQKHKELQLSPYSCLMESNIERTPWQIEAFIAAIQAIKNGGIILADEVGLGKTIEAGLVIKYLLKNGAKRILIIMPPPLRKQWKDELEEKFNIKSEIPESKYSVQNRDEYTWTKQMKYSDELVIITSYGIASWFIQRFSEVKWDCIIFDEAHRLRNFGNGAKMPRNIFNVTRHIPKIMLTATPLQNNLRELFALSQYIDERIFINEKVFDEIYVKTEDHKGLRDAISPILHRTLRKDVTEYMTFSKRDCMTVDFNLNREEAILYQLVKEYLQRPVLYAITANNNALVKMVIRKLLASSSYAVVETFEVLKKRLKVLRENTRVKKADISLQSFFSLIDDDDDNSTGDNIDDDDIETIERYRYRTEIDNELSVIENIIKIASQIKTNSKSDAVIKALTFAFDIQKEKGYPEKALIFTESKRTQKYLVESLIVAGFDKILVFNGEMNDPETKKIYNAWKALNQKRITTPNVDLKQAIVEQFEREAKILIATDVASEGLNLQFCDTVINYDLPWNPMKIEQRIGRCHRFGQSRDVWVYNLLNRENPADARVYEILDQKFHLFKGVFGASDESLGLLDSGSNFEKRLIAIYEKCKNDTDVKREFDKLEREIEAKRNKKKNDLKQILSAVSSAEKKRNLSFTANDIKNYIEETALWSEIAKNVKPVTNSTMQITQTKIKFDDINESHGYVFVGVMAKSTNEFIQPFLMVFDNNGEILNYTSKEIVRTFQSVPDSSFITFSPDNSEKQIIINCMDKIALSIAKEFVERSKPVIVQNNKRIKNWVYNQKEQYKVESDDIKTKISVLKIQKSQSSYFQEKIEIQKKIEKLEKELKKRDENFHTNMLEIDRQAKEARTIFNTQFQIEPIVLVNLVVRF